MRAQDFGEGIDTLQQKGVYDALVDLWGEEFSEEIQSMAERSPDVLRVKDCENVAEEWAQVTGRDVEEFDDFETYEVNAFVLSYDGYIYYFD